MGLVHELHVVVIVSEVQGIVCKQLRKTVIALTDVAKLIAQTLLYAQSVILYHTFCKSVNTIHCTALFFFAEL